MNLYSFTKDQLSKILPRYVLLAEEIQQEAKGKSVEPHLHLIRDAFDVDHFVYAYMIDIELGVMGEDRIKIMAAIYQLTGLLAERQMEEDTSSIVRWVGQPGAQKRLACEFAENYALTVYLRRINKEAERMLWS